MSPDERIARLEGFVAHLLASDRYTFQKSLQLFDGRNIQLGTKVGTKIGTAATQYLGFYGVAPITQSAAITPCSGGGGADNDAIDNSARAKIDSIRNVLKNIGLTA